MFENKHTEEGACHLICVKRMLCNQPHALPEHGQCRLVINTKVMNINNLASTADIEN